jgi:hypothetical protein
VIRHEVVLVALDKADAEHLAWCQRLGRRGWIAVHDEPHTGTVRDDVLHAGV